MTIGEAARLSGVSAKMIRWYEARGLLPPADRSDSGYRRYGEADVHTLRFVRRARDLGWTVDGIADLLALWRDRSRRSAEVKALAAGHIAALQRRIAELEGMVDTLSHLAESCHGDARPECPILADLAGVAAPGEAPGVEAAPAARFGKGRGRAGRRAAATP
ncbi:MAG TPA: Cu(I)-responsive transcriptional regulator [Acetobacteraceae bacterium]|nr:Cu(I)-responsive transcriptional regulator [Acetobacteraceae bacterium]